MGSAPLESLAGDLGWGVMEMNQNSPLKQLGSESHRYMEATTIAREAWERPRERRVGCSGQGVSGPFTPALSHDN